MGVIDVVFSHDLSCHCPVIARTRFLDVGNGGQADVEPLVGLVQLPAERLGIGLGKGQVIHGRQDIEIGVRDPHDQIQFRRR